MLNPVKYVSPSSFLYFNVHFHLRQGPSRLPRPLLGKKTPRRLHRLEGRLEVREGVRDLATGVRERSCEEVFFLGGGAQKLAGVPTSQPGPRKKNQEGETPKRPKEQKARSYKDLQTQTLWLWLQPQVPSVASSPGVSRA